MKSATPDLAAQALPHVSRDDDAAEKNAVVMIVKAGSIVGR